MSTTHAFPYALFEDEDAGLDTPELMRRCTENS